MEGIAQWEREREWYRGRRVEDTSRTLSRLWLPIILPRLRRTSFCMRWVRGEMIPNFSHSFQFNWQFSFISFKDFPYFALPRLQTASLAVYWPSWRYTRVGVSGRAVCQNVKFSIFFIQPRLIWERLPLITISFTALLELNFVENSRYLCALQVFLPYWFIFLSLAGDRLLEKHFLFIYLGGGGCAAHQRVRTCLYALCCLCDNNDSYTTTF